MFGSPPPHLTRTFTLTFLLDVSDILVDAVKHTGRAPFLSLGRVQQKFFPDVFSQELASVIPDRSVQRPKLAFDGVREWRKRETMYAL